MSDNDIPFPVREAIHRDVDAYKVLRFAEARHCAKVHARMNTPADDAALLQARQAHINAKGDATNAMLREALGA